MIDLARHDRIRALRWQPEGALALLDQRLLPREQRWIDCHEVDQVVDAIRALAVRGAPAIGIAAAYGVALAAREPGADIARIEAAIQRLWAARPTAVNLMWALSRQREVLARTGADAGALLAEAQAIEAADYAANRSMALAGADCIAEGSAVMTICNTGSLATAGLGTALGVIRAAHAAGKLRALYACETRPWLQGSRLTLWELGQDGIPCKLIGDGAAAWVIKRERIDWVIAGADRICANGDTANKIGTYGLALAARQHGARTMIVAPCSTIDPATPEGDDIEIEERDPAELLGCGGVRIAPEGAAGYNPVFDVTPATLISTLVTERGVLHRPDRAGIARLLGGDPG
jgi:methylthioribose-1-phosphate isomerase